VVGALAVSAVAGLPPPLRKVIRESSRSFSRTVRLASSSFSQCSDAASALSQDLHRHIVSLEALFVDAAINSLRHALSRGREFLTCLRFEESSRGDARDFKCAYVDFEQCGHVVQESNVTWERATEAARLIQLESRVIVTPRDSAR
jgi:hypothetical protein